MEPAIDSATVAPQPADPLLHEEVACHQIDTVKEMLLNGSDPNILDESENLSPLLIAAFKDDHAMAQLLLESGADPDLPGRQAWTALHAAANGDFLSIVSLMVEYGANVDIQNRRGLTPLATAASAGNMTSVCLLIDSGANIHIRDKKDQSPLYQAVVNGHSHVTNLLLEQGADAFTEGFSALKPAFRNGHTDAFLLVSRKAKDDAEKTPQKWTLLHEAATRGDCELAAMLMVHGNSPGVQDGNLWTPLDIAVRLGCLEMAIMFVDAFPYLFHWLKKVECLYRACDGRNIELAMFFLNRIMFQGETDFREGMSLFDIIEQGLDDAVAVGPNETNPEPYVSAGAWRLLVDATGRGNTLVISLFYNRFPAFASLPLATSLFLLAATNSPTILREMIQYGVRPSASDESGFTALHAASHSGVFTSVRLLLDHGVPADIHDDAQQTPIHLAAEQGHTKIVEVLLEYGASFNDPDPHSNCTLLFHYASQGHLELVKYLLRRGADPNHVENSGGLSALHAAADHGHLLVAKELVENGADMEIEDFHGRNPLSLARIKGQRRVAAYLLTAMHRRNRA